MEKTRCVKNWDGKDLVRKDLGRKRKTEVERTGQEGPSGEKT